jgi:hypothetical protein
MQLTKLQLTETILRQCDRPVPHALIQKIANKISDKQLIQDAKQSGLNVQKTGHNKFIINQKLT